ncbi:hypothetical protein SLA2020_148000 [Shorea laevis]
MFRRNTVILSSSNLAKTRLHPARLLSAQFALSCPPPRFHPKKLSFGSSRMKLKVVCRKLYDYIRYDLKEIAFPSSLPDPPHRVKKQRKLTLQEWISVFKKASRLYVASWVRDVGPDLRPNDYKKDETSEDKSNETKSTPKEKEPSTLEDLAVAARGGMETLRPALQRVYMTRASAYRDALKSFIEGYQEGIQQVMEKKEDSKPQQEGDTQKKSPSP